MESSDPDLSRGERSPESVDTVSTSSTTSPSTRSNNPLADFWPLSYASIIAEGSLTILSPWCTESW